MKIQQTNTPHEDDDENDATIEREWKAESKAAHAQRLADALRSTMARLEYAHSKVAFDTKHHEALNKASEALAQWEGVKS